MSAASRGGEGGIEVTVLDLDKLQAAFHRIAELTVTQRALALLELERRDSELAAAVRDLLAVSERSATPLDRPALRVPAELEGALEPEPFPEVPGYRLRQQIGRGGSATVYLADQEHSDFVRQVALKVIDRVVDPEALRRVRDEQRILARLEHPGIARLYDAGVTPSGRPFLAMEHVEGTSILAHCRAHDLSVRQRLELVLDVLAAMEYAHGEGIVHRDLKPANILVSARGEAKVLDFGIAKIVADPGEDEETRTLRRAMTPAYASPEQVRGGRVTVGSDVYSMGVVLYELLAETLPYRLDGGRFLTVEDAIRDQDPEAPSAAVARRTRALPRTTGSSAADRQGAREHTTLARRRRALRGDLDAILLKALRKETAARYLSIAEMARDLRASLLGEPVAARRGGWRYRVGKSLKRRRGVIASATILVLVGAGAMASLRGGWFDKSANSLLRREFSSALAARPNEPETGRALRAGAEQMVRYDFQAARQSFLEATRTSPGDPLAWDGLARAQQGLGEVGRAAEAARRAVDTLSPAAVASLPADEATRLRARGQAANNQWGLAIPTLEGLFGRQSERLDIGLDLVGALLAAGRGEAAATALGRLRQLRGRLRNPSDEASDPRLDLLEAEVAMRVSEYQSAAIAATRARTRFHELGFPALGLRAERLHAEATARLDRREEARVAFEAIAAGAAKAGLEREAAAARLGLGTVLSRVARNEEAQQVLDQALAGLVAAGDERGEVAAQVQLAVLAGKRGELLAGLERADRALSQARALGDRWSEGHVLSQRLVLQNWADDEKAVTENLEPTLTALRESGNRHTLLSALANAAIAAIERMELDRAQGYLDEGAELSRRVGSQLLSAQLDRTRGFLEQSRGDYDLARQRYLSAIEKARGAGVAFAWGGYLANLAWLEVDANRPEEAGKWATEAAETLRAGGDQRGAADVEGVLAWAEARRGDAAAARRRLAGLRERAAQGDPGLARFNLLLVEALVAEELGDYRRAVSFRHRAIDLASDWKTPGLVIEQKAGLARVLHKMGDRKGLDALCAELLPEVERLGLRGLARQLRSLLTVPRA